VTERTESIELIDDERIVPYGAARTTWLVRQGEGWIAAAQWPGASTESRNAGPGTVWERAVKLALPRGTELMRVESRPRPEAPKDLFAYFGKKGAHPRTTRRTRYRVEAGGRVRPVPQSP
jgi:hypothetical protein